MRNLKTQTTGGTSRTTTLCRLCKKNFISSKRDFRTWKKVVKLFFFSTRCLLLVYCWKALHQRAIKGLYCGYNFHSTEFLKGERFKKCAFDALVLCISGCQNAVKTVWEICFMEGNDAVVARMFTTCGNGIWGPERYSSPQSTFWVWSFLISGRHFWNRTADGELGNWSRLQLDSFALTSLDLHSS